MIDWQQLSTKDGHFHEWYKVGSLTYYCKGCLNQHNLNPVSFHEGRPKAVVLSTGHAGSEFIAEGLRRVGVKAAREKWFRTNHFGRIHYLDVDSSGVAVPLLPEDWAGITWHQVREPLQTIESIANTAVFSGPVWTLRQRSMRQVHPDTEYLANAIQIYVDFNLAAEALADRRWRVEDVDGDLLYELAEAVDVQPKTLAPLPEPTTNKHLPTPYQLAWSDLPTISAVKDLREMADRYGYRNTD